MGQYAMYPPPRAPAVCFARIGKFPSLGLVAKRLISRPSDKELLFFINNKASRVIEWLASLVGISGLTRHDVDSCLFAMFSEPNCFNLISVLLCVGRVTDKQFHIPYTFKT